MATTAESPSTPTVPAGRAGENINSPQFRRKNLQSPWKQVVRGEVMESLSAVHSSPSSSSLSTASQPEQTPFSDCSPPKTDSPSPPLDICSAGEGSDVNNSNVARQTKLAWNKLSNGVLEAGSVMDAVSWPALSESTKALPKSSVDSSLKIVTDAAFSTSQGPVIPESPQKQATNNANPNSTTNHIFPVRQRSMKRGGGGNNRGGSTHSGFTHPPPSPPPFPVFQIAPNGYHNLPGVPDPSHRDFPYRSSHWETRPAGGFVSPSHSANDHQNTFRRGNFGPHQRRDGTYHNNHGGRRDHDRGNYGNARDVHLQPHRAPPRGFVRPPQPNAAAYVNPPMMRPFVNPMGFHDFYYIPPVSMEPYRPFIPPRLPFLMPIGEPLPLPALLVQQINYYFSDDNLVTDDYLRSRMDDQGWVPIALIANFPRVKKLSTSITYILDCLRPSTVVEVQDNKVRKRHDWKKWIPASALHPSVSGSVSPNNSSHDSLGTSFQEITMEEVDTNQSGVTGKADPNPEPDTGRCLTVSTGESQIPNGEVTQNTYTEEN